MEGEIHIQPSSASLSKVSNILDGLYTQKEVIGLHKAAVEKNPSAFPPKELENIEKRIQNLNLEIKEWKTLISQKPDASGKLESLDLVPSRLLHEPVYYADYLKLDKLLSSQQLLSEASGNPAHDEMLFIITHQTYELWFKQITYEIQAVMKIMDTKYVTGQQIYRAVHYLSRVNQILKVLVSQFDILETMTPLDFLDFRDYLYPASGFQSFQFRLLENLLGLRPADRILHDKKAYHTKLSPIHSTLVQDAEKGISLFELVERWLERNPFISDDSSFNFLESYKQSVQKMFEEDKRIIMFGLPEGEERTKELQKLEDNKRSLIEMFDETAFNQGKRGRLSFRATQAALLIFVYQEEPVLQIPFRFLQALIDIDENMTSWRYRHALMVHRIIGTKIGTGGSSGYWYLKSAIERSRIFVDFGNLCTFLIPRKDLPPLPQSLKTKLGLVAEN